jgi:hypothetical protein
MRLRGAKEQLSDGQADSPSRSASGEDGAAQGRVTTALVVGAVGLDDVLTADP